MTRPVERRYVVQRLDPVKGWTFACSLIRATAEEALAYARAHFHQPVRLEPKR